jgi:hypothetical protein
MHGSCEVHEPELSEIVMPGLDPGIHVLLFSAETKSWMAGSSPAMTKQQMPVDHHDH